MKTICITTYVAFKDGVLQATKTTPTYLPKRTKVISSMEPEQTKDFKRELENDD